MTTPRPLLALGALALLLAGAPVHAAGPCDEGPVPSESRGGDDSGIGGTGIELGAGDGGIGGTGIYGAITRTAPLCVNGLQLHLAATTRVSINGRAATASQLGPGHVVWVRAAARGERLVAEHIEAHSALVGPLVEVDAANARIVLGTTPVRVPAGASLVDEQGAPLAGLGELRPGDSLDVSGLRDPEDRWIATRVARVTGAASAPYSGPPAAALFARSEGLHELSVEGYVHAASAGLVRVGGLDFESAALSHVPRTGERIWLRGEVGADRRLRASGVTAPPLPEPRDPVPPPPHPVPEGRRPGPGRLDASDLPGVFEPSPREPARVEPRPLEPPGHVPAPRPRPEPVLERPIPPPAPEPIPREPVAPDADAPRSLEPQP